MRSDRHRGVWRRLAAGALGLAIFGCLTLACAAAAPSVDAGDMEKLSAEATTAAPAESPPSPSAAAPPAAPPPAVQAPAQPSSAAAPAARTPDDLQKYFPSWARREIFGMAMWQILGAFVLVLGSLVLKKVSDFIFSARLIPLLEKTPFGWDNMLAEAVSKPLGYLILLGGLAAALWALALPQEPTDVRGLAFAAVKVALAAIVLWFLFRLVDMVAMYLARLAGRTESKLDDQLIPLIRKALKVTVGIILAVWVVQLLGYSVSSLLAGLGIGGLAVALALQDTLANFFGSVFIFLDRPFGVGDMVKIGDVEGTVEEIGFRSTRIRTWPQTLVCIPNKAVAAATVDNWSRMPKRRVLQAIGLTYETTADQMEKAVAAIRGILEKDQGVDPEFIVVRFTDFGASSLDIQVYYFTRDIAYADHMTTRERVNLAMVRAIKDLGLSIAFPTRTVYFEGDVARRMAQPPGPDRPASDN